MFRTRPISDLRHEAYHKGPSRAEVEAAKQFSRLALVTAYLREHGHDGAVVLPLPLSQLNRPRHWCVTAKLKKQYYEYCHILLNARLLPAPPAEVPDHATIEVQYFVHSKLDSDNLAACNKNILDFLKAHYIKDDSDKHLRVIMKEQVVDRKVPRVVIRFI